MQEEAQQQQQSQYSEELGEQQRSEGPEQDEQQALQDTPQSSAGRIGFIGAGQVQHRYQAAAAMQQHRNTVS